MIADDLTLLIFAILITLPRSTGIIFTSLMFKNIYTPPACEIIRVAHYHILRNFSVDGELDGEFDPVIENEPMEEN